jgi:hypothetical protein
MEKWVKRSGSNAIPVVFEFLHHRHAEDWLMGRMNQHMEPNKAGEKLSLMTFHNATVPLGSKLPLFDIEIRYRVIAESPRSGWE